MSNIALVLKKDIHNNVNRGNSQRVIKESDYIGYMYILDYILIIRQNFNKINYRAHLVLP